MIEQKFKVEDRGSTESCPRCGNTTEFVCLSEQVQEDGCEIWCRCKCGYDPFSWRDRIESVMGGIDQYVCLEVLTTWNEILLYNMKHEDGKAVPHCD